MTTQHRVEERYESDTQQLANMTRLLNVANRRDHRVNNLITVWEKLSRDHFEEATRIREVWDGLTPEERRQRDVTLADVVRYQEEGRRYARFAEELKEAVNVEP